MQPTIERTSDGFRLFASARIRQPRARVFGFFSDARNLERITPPLLKFSILTEGPIDMCVGALIDYRLRIRGLPLRWRTEITAWDPPHRFEDTQLKGPYRQWIHEHRFHDEGEWTRMEDTVHYRVLGGRLVNRLFVAPDVLKIFTYRNAMLQSIFGDADGGDV
ncbi:MAG: SRPBCC family protein [Phycisphaerales bacterium]|nr:SRPBCC family protein [Phycisphaerales bacterium]